MAVNILHVHVHVLTIRGYYNSGQVGITVPTQGGYDVHMLIPCCQPGRPTTHHDMARSLQQGDVPHRAYHVRVHTNQYCMEY